LLIDAIRQGPLDERVGIDAIASESRSTSRSSRRGAQTKGALSARAFFPYLDVVPRDARLRRCRARARQINAPPKTRMREALRDLRDEYGYVIIDCPRHVALT